MKPLSHRIGDAGGGLEGDLGASSALRHRLLAAVTRDDCPERDFPAAVAMPEPPLRLLVFTAREPERGFGPRRLQQRGRGEEPKQKRTGRSALDEEPQTVRQKGWRGAQEDGRGDGGGSDQLFALFVVFCRVSEPLSPPPSRPLGRSRSVLGAARYALCDAFSAPANALPPCVLPSLTSFPSPPRLSGFGRAAGKRRRAKCVRGGRFQKAAAAKEEPGETDAPPSYGGIDTPKTRGGVLLGAEAFTDKLLSIFPSCLLRSPGTYQCPSSAELKIRPCDHRRSPRQAAAHTAYWPLLGVQNPALLSKRIQEDKNLSY